MDNSFSGVATYEYSDGRIYSGDFVNGLPHGKRSNDLSKSRHLRW